jgi:hypothetical protein
VEDQDEEEEGCKNGKKDNVNDDDKRDPSIREREGAEVLMLGPSLTSSRSLKTSSGSCVGALSASIGCWMHRQVMLLTAKGWFMLYRDIYHQHGWPVLAQDRKLECLEVVQIVRSIRSII